MSTYKRIYRAVSQLNFYSSKKHIFFIVLSGLVLGILSLSSRSQPVKAQGLDPASQVPLKSKKRDNPFLAHKGFLRIAHQGASAHFPPNTILAFSRALKPPYNADVLEFDLRLTKDKVIVIFHDKNLKRITGLDRDLHTLKLPEIQRLDAAYNFIPQKNRNSKPKLSKPIYPYRGKGIRIPTLEEVFQAFPQRLMLMEVKSQQQEEGAKELIETAWKLIKKYKRIDKTMVSSFSHQSILHFRSLSRGQLATGASRPEGIYYLLRCYLLSSPCEVAFDAMQIPQLKKLNFWLGIDLGGPKLINFAHQNGIKVHYWTINERADMQKLIRNGADGIVSDFLDRLPRSYQR